MEQSRCLVDCGRRSAFVSPQAILEYPATGAGQVSSMNVFSANIGIVYGEYSNVFLFPYEGPIAPVKSSSYDEINGVHLNHPRPACS